MVLPNPFPAGIQTAVTVTTKVTTPITKYKFKKAGTAGTLISIVLDESGSMGSCWDTTIAGFNEFVEGQKAATAVAGAAYLTLNKFDAPHIKNVYADRPISEVPALDRNSYRPNGGTNLLDAIGHAITQVNEALDKRKKADRPGVIIVITTDGEENASTTYSSQQIKDMVKAAEKADWSFVFLGANIDSFAVGSTFGMNASNSVNYSTQNMAGTYSSLSATTTRMRSAKMAGTSTADIYQTVMFTDDEKKAME